MQTSHGENFDAFMALELYDKSLNGIREKFHDNPAFQPVGDELELFEKKFPHKERRAADIQLK
jgi:hypothetical protein